MWFENKLGVDLSEKYLNAFASMKISLAFLAMEQSIAPLQNRFNGLSSKSQDPLQHR